MDIALLTSSVQNARNEILSGQVFAGIDQIHRLKKTGYRVDLALIEDIIDLPCLLQYLYDETYIGDAVTATRALVALKDLGYQVDSRKINYIRFKKLSLIGMQGDRYFEKARPGFRTLLRTLRSFFTEVGDYRECMLHKSDNRLTFEEDVIVRFPNLHFRDLFLRLAFQQAIESGLSFHWENHHSILNQELTRRISWSMIQSSTVLPPDWYHTIKGTFDEFINSLVAKMEAMELPRYFPAGASRREMLWIVCSRDATIGQRICSSLRNYNTLHIQDLALLERYQQQDDGTFGAFIFHVSIRDFDVLTELVRYKLMHPAMGAPYIIFADQVFFKIMKNQSLLFPGCEWVSVMNPENIQNLEYVIDRVQNNRRRFVRLPLEMECRAVFGKDRELTRATPVSPGGTFVRTHRIVPIYSNTEITLKDLNSGFEETTTGRVVYNAKGGTAVEFENIISFEKVQKLRELSLEQHARILDTLKRSQI